VVVIRHAEDVEDAAVAGERDEVDLGAGVGVAQRRQAAARDDDRPHAEELHHRDLADRPGQVGRVE